ncbi:MAG: hypothetical protein KBT06_11545 [Prevotellaceae bacterium]|nr:hypothetical protein [Candidatus Colivivens equi]
MSNIYKFESAKIKRINKEEYDEDEFIIATMDFLGTNPNSHKLNFSEEVFRRDISTVLGKWVVAEVKDGDVTTHTSNEIIVGQVIKDQDVEIIENEDGYLRAVVDVVLSKIYAKECCDVFTEDDSNRSVSVEIMCGFDEDNENDVQCFKIVGVTLLGKTVNPSSPTSNIQITRFSEEEVSDFYHSKCPANQLEAFAQERRAKSYKINKTELKDIDWGGVDKTALRKKIMAAKNRNTLVKAVYALVEDGWEENPSQHLKYPLMVEIDGTFYYVKEALSSALAYAKQHDEQVVINKVQKLYKKFDLAEDSNGKEETQMSELEQFAALDIGEMWRMVHTAIRKKDNYYYGIKGIFEDDGQKFVILTAEDGLLYRVDFDWNSKDGVILADTITRVEENFETIGEVTKFAEPENVEQYRAIEKPAEMSEIVEELAEEPTEEEELSDPEQVEEVDFEAECKNLQAKCEEQANLIMEQEAELQTLREFKQGIESAQKLAQVNEVLEKVKGHVDEAKYNEFAESADTYTFAEISAWKNMVFAYCGEHLINFAEENKETHTTEFRMSAPTEEPAIVKDCWDRMG